MIWRHAWIGLGLVAGVMAAGFLYTRSANFRLSDIHVTSSVPSLTKRVESQLVPLLGNSLISISLFRIRRQIEEIPRVKSVRIRRVWPNRLEVRVEARDAVALTFKKGKLVKMDDRGDVIEAMSAAEPLPLLVDFRMELPLAQREGVFSFLNQRVGDPGTGFLSLRRLDFVRWDPERGLDLEWVEDACRVFLGFEQWESRWARTVQAADSLLARGVRPLVLDAAYRSRVVALKHQKLQNFESGLDLNELARRKEPAGPVSAR